MSRFASQWSSQIPKWFTPSSTAQALQETPGSHLTAFSLPPGHLEFLRMTSLIQLFRGISSTFCYNVFIFQQLYRQISITYLHTFLLLTSLLPPPPPFSLLALFSRLVKASCCIFVPICPCFFPISSYYYCSV